MKADRARRLVGEFLVIVIGVLVALAVDDWRDYRNERALEAHLLERLREDLRADAGDLAIAESVLRRRTWIFSEIDAGLREGRPGRPMPDSVAFPVGLDRILAEAGRPEPLREDPLWVAVDEHPLYYLVSTPEFDMSDDAFQEMIVGGTLRTLRDPDLRSSILAYYRTARDMAANVMGQDDYMEEWTDLLLDAGLAEGDSVSLDELVRVAEANPRMATQVRHALARADGQDEFLGRIADALEELRAALDERR
jgi:hypothetical protein